MAKINRDHFQLYTVGIIVLCVQFNHCTTNDSNLELSDVSLTPIQTAATNCSTLSIISSNINGGCDDSTTNRDSIFESFDPEVMKEHVLSAIVNDKQRMNQISKVVIDFFDELNSPEKFPAAILVKKEIKELWEERLLIAQNEDAENRYPSHHWGENSPNESLVEDAVELFYNDLIGKFNSTREIFKGVAVLLTYREVSIHKEVNLVKLSLDVSFRLSEEIMDFPVEMINSGNGWFVAGIGKVVKKKSDEKYIKPPLEHIVSKSNEQDIDIINQVSSVEEVPSTRLPNPETDKE